MAKQSKGQFSVVIPTLNEGDLLHMTVDSILEETTYPSYEVIVVDDGSTDGSCDRYADYDERVRLVRSGGLGVARARNLGASHAHGSYICFIDAHCRVSGNWLDEFAWVLDSPDVGMVGPAFTKLDEPEPRGCGMAWVDATLETAWFFPQGDNRAYEVPLTTGACQAFRKDVFDSTGRYEDGFTRWGFEDVEMCLRLWLLGYRVKANSAVTVAHHFRESRNYDVDDRKIVFNYLRMIHMHFSAPRIRRVLKAVSSNPDLIPALDDLFASDVLEVREELYASRVRDDDWFFNHFGPATLRMA